MFERVEADVFVEGKYYGRISWRLARRAFPIHTTTYCHRCGETWLVLSILGANQHIHVRQLCTRCKGLGSARKWTLGLDVEDFNLELLEREVLVASTDPAKWVAQDGISFEGF